MRTDDRLVVAAGDLVAAHRTAEHNARRPDEPRGAPRGPDRVALDAPLQAAANAALRRFRSLRGLRVGDRVRVRGGRYDGNVGDVVALVEDVEAEVALLGDRGRPRRFLLAALELPPLEALVAAYDLLDEAGEAVPDRAELELRARTRHG